MSSLTDDIGSKAVGSASQTIQATAQALKATTDVATKGICIGFQESAFTAQSLMKAINYAILKKTGDVTFSSANVSIKELSQNGKLELISENISKDVMQIFDKHCKKDGIKYRACIDNTDPQKPEYKVFFSGRDDKVIEEFLRRSYTDYIKQSEKPKNKEKTSIKAKIAFFQNGAKKKENQQEKSGERSL